MIDRWIRNTHLAPPQPWCAAFAFSMFLAVGDAPGVSQPAAVFSWVEWADAHHARVGRPFRGDLVAYSWHGADPHPDDHIGFVERVLALPWPRNRGRFYLRTVEGNVDSAVRRKWRWVDPRAVAFIRVPDLL
jgi:CHAP domain